MFKSCCDGHFLQRACCPSAVWVLGVVLYDKPAQKSTSGRKKTSAHTSFKLFLNPFLIPIKHSDLKQRPTHTSILSVPQTLTSLPF